MTELKNYDGMRFYNYVVIKRSHKDKYGKWLLLCKCDCGKEFYVPVGSFSNWKSCGCMRYKLIGQAHIKHGHVYEKLNHIWRCMKQRCKNPNNRTYPFYGGRGIKVCPEWDESYAAFREWAYSNGYFDTTDRSACTLDRIDPNGDYEPSNCRWVDMREQSNNRRSNHFVTYKGETHTIAEWSRIVGIRQETIYARIKYGWSPEKTLETPLGETRKVKKKGNYFYNGDFYTAHGLANAVGIDPSLLYWRLKHGWSLKDALVKPNEKKA